MISGFANPQRFLGLSNWLLPITSVLAVIVSAIGVVWSLLYAPADYQQGETARIMYIHVPSAWIAVGAYTGMAIGSISYLVWGHALGDIAAKVMAPIGAAFTALCLATGSIWGRPTWGTWWEWDGRLTSVLVLFFLYLGYMALRSALDETSKASKAAAILCLVGTINIPIIRFSVEWWNTLHQKASIIREGGPSLDPSLLHPLLVMGIAYLLIFAALTLAAMRAEIWKRSADAIQARLQA
ncbi:MAG: heme ABC transporter permease [Hyphomonadaceae bacterium]|jgi:heme exporter protein C|uniref:heme ABC transporter permease n=1 Tax=Aquidulcibacter sp. TaxID=2052990 RepID=UPI0022C95986|nr:heme ABC transporter permease [Aquidulcibacter sp.]MCZ8207925.1 heme ABC transporter permease [Aquidulcibacter sp.]